MKKSALAVVVLAAGQGTRMKSALPKVLHRIAGRPMLGHVLCVAKELGAMRLLIVTAPDSAEVARLASDWGGEPVVQQRQLGTGHAVLQSEAALARFDGILLVLFGDTPLLTEHTLRRLVQAADQHGMAALGFRAAKPKGYGRMIVEGDELFRIVEEKDANESERQIDLCFAGMLAARSPAIFQLLHQVGNNNAQGEFYLTDVTAIARRQGVQCKVVEGSESEMLGVNSRAQLAEAERVFQNRKRAELMENGAGLIAPETVFVSADTVIEPDTTVGPYVVFGPGVTVRRGAKILPFCHIEGATVGESAIVGPFARLRPGAVLEASVHVGNFVEVKNARLETGAKANHLTYLGDARVGQGSNIGAGTITCNYDGEGKYFTDIGAGVFIGSDSTLVAPVKIGDGAYVGAGSTITTNVEAESLAIGRARQVNKEGRAKTIRARNKARKQGNR
ncbi:MAG TPA: bifunctional UDP-N-acetylglucosamine diphosphorylase/glucosamine-1-phosphate N-acetyltransferase GlmU [Micropepsaceae bacterium]|nr:bifunctional UDP-N-acetylglucosamine diphosphorylase/glucosamine-1-phosphate N-acetyltransferase GlmU [Micropepsaceae bacterium]